MGPGGAYRSPRVGDGIDGREVGGLGGGGGGVGVAHTARLGSGMEFMVGRWGDWRQVASYPTSVQHHKESPMPLVRENDTVVEAGGVFAPRLIDLAEQIGTRRDRPGIEGEGRPLAKVSSG